MSTNSSERVRTKLWGPEELSEYLGVPVSWVYKRCAKKAADRIPHIKLGKYLRFDPEADDFQGWLAAHRTSSLPAIIADDLTVRASVHRLQTSTVKTGHFN
jgi:hypothetical protein